MVGISKDSVPEKLCDKKVPFVLIADEGQAVSIWCMGPKSLWGESLRYCALHLIDEEGVVSHVFSKVRTKTHGEDVLVVWRAAPLIRVWIL